MAFFVKIEKRYLAHIFWKLDWTIIKIVFRAGIYPVYNIG